MKYGEFIAVFDKLIDKCNAVLNQRRDDYSGQGRDRLHNFKEIASRRKKSPEAACMDLVAKQEVARDDYIFDISTGNIRPIEEWEEKIIDIINYHVLLYALLIDRANEGKVKRDKQYGFTFGGTKEDAAVKRASMDLSRAPSELRKTKEDE